MPPRLPPPDPHETLGMSPSIEAEIPAPMVVFPLGPPSRNSERVADAWLDIRPGALIVVAAGNQ
jgi:hypothetical protein